MNNLIRHTADSQGPIVETGNALLGDVYFDLLHLEPGEEQTLNVPGFELVLVVQSGACTITCDNQIFRDVGDRRDIWSGKADSVYAGTAETILIMAGAEGCALAVAGGACFEPHASFRIRPDEVESVVVGSAETKSKREIFHILGQNGNGRAGKLLVSELYAEDGCWSGYPPHKHDTAREGETNHAELYHYRFNPPSGFGAQLHYNSEDARAEIIRDGDTYLLPSGYHPTVTSPGHRAYVFTILVGRDQRGLVQYFDPDHTHLIDYIPGLAGMRDKFK